MLALSEGSSPVTAQGGLCFVAGLRYHSRLERLSLPLAIFLANSATRARSGAPLALAALTDGPEGLAPNFWWAADAPAGVNCIALSCTICAFGGLAAPQRTRYWRFSNWTFAQAI